MNNNSKNVDTDDTEKCRVEQQEHKYTDSASSIRRKDEDGTPRSQKQDADHNNNNNIDSTNLTNAMVSEKKELQRLLYKVDSRIIPLISLCYTFSFMDRTNIGIYI